MDAWTSHEHVLAVLASKGVPTIGLRYQTPTRNKIVYRWDFRPIGIVYGSFDSSARLGRAITGKDQRNRSLRKGPLPGGPRGDSSELVSFHCCRRSRT